MVRRLYVSIAWHFAFAVAQFEFAEPRGEVALGKADVPCIAVEFAAVHHAVGVGNLGSAAFVCTGDGGIFLLELTPSCSIWLSRLKLE